jgi:hypothetical protein
MDLRSDGPNQTKREGERTAGHLQGPNGGAMAGIGPSSPEFIDTAIPGITEQKEGM